jgi:HAD superfamily hydrolase (TIGR01490 family)
LEQQKSYIAFFDLDRTIIYKNSGAVLVRQAYKNGLLNTRSLLNAVYQSFLYKFHLRETDLIISKMGSWVKGFPEESLKNLSESIVTNFLLNSIRPEIFEEINFHKSHNADVVLLSSAISPICIPIGEHLKMDHIICSEMEVVDGILTGKSVGNYCFEEEKVRRLINYCKKKNKDPGKSWYYGDSISDLLVLNVVGHPVCVNPDKKLRKKATQLGWKILI